MEKRKKIVSFFILFSFVLFFAHSELNLFSESAQRCKHNHQDFCEVVKVTRIEKSENLHQKITVQDFHFNDNCCYECKKINDYLQNTDLSPTKKFSIVNTYLFNRTLLI